MYMNNTNTPGGGFDVFVTFTYTPCMENAQLYNENCIPVMERLQSGSVDLLLTDPPYNLGNFMKKRATNLPAMRENFFGATDWDNLDTHEWEASMDDFFRLAARVLKPGGALVVFMAIIKVETLIALAQRHGFYYKTTGIWHKTNPMPRNMHLQFVNSTEAWLYFTRGEKTGTFNHFDNVVHDFIETGKAPAAEKKHGTHPTQKPVALMRFFVRSLSNEGETVLDPFMGSGTTGVAAGELGRKFIGAETNGAYFATAQKRINSL